VKRCRQLGPRDGQRSDLGCGERNPTGDAPSSLSGDRPPRSRLRREFCAEVNRLRAAIRGAGIAITRDEDSAAAAQILIAVQAEEVRDA
jgi:hypothetical protein